MPDHLLESGDSPELEALFDRVAYQGQAPAPAPVAMAPSPSFDTGSGDSPELEALFDSVAQSAHALRRNDLSAAAKVRPAFSLTLTRLTPGRLISDGSSAVAMFTPGLFSRFRQV